MIPFARRIWVIHQDQVAIAIMPKVACTSIKRTLFKVYGRESFKQTFHAEDVVPDDYVRIMPVRNPWERARSCYANKILCDPIRPTLVEMGCRPFMPFEEFLEIVARTTDDKMDKHLTPQHVLYNSPRWGTPNVLLRFEHLAQDWKHLRLTFVRWPFLERHNISTVKKPDWTPRAVQLVSERYGDDVLLLGYSAP